MVADIRSVDDDLEVVRLGRLIQTYQARITELSVQRNQIAMADEATNTVARAEALASGGAYQPVRSAEQIDDEMAVLRAAIRRVDAQAVDARAMATIRITRDAKLHERAEALRIAVAAGIDDLMRALNESEQFVGQLDQAGISAVGSRWPGAADDRLHSLLAAHRIDLGDLPVDRLAAVERRAGRRSDPPIVPERPAPIVAKSVRKRITDKLDQIGEQMFVWARP
jgi:hypothetical protein